MASTSLFAPIVRAVQPAFIYNNITGGVDIYFSLSTYNELKDVTGLLYTIIDPNKVSTWGTNSMIKTEAAPLGYMGVAKSRWTQVSADNNEYYIHLNLTSNNYQTFTTNQYYQVQLYLISKDLPASNIINSEWLTDNSNYISVASQATLIRPIDSPTIKIIGNGSSTYDFSELTGSISDTEETFDSYYCHIDEKDSSMIRGSGQNFSIPLDDFNLAEGLKYSGTFYYTTLHGYSPSSGVEFSITYSAPAVGVYSITVISDITKGAIRIQSPIDGELQRKSEYSSSWQTLTDELVADGGYYYYYDYTIESDIQYTYRVVYNNKANCTGSGSGKVSFEDIFLANEEAMMVIRYNPNISGFKYVVQEAITNTLGGKYPIIRKNGDTKYRQFNLSGSLFIDCTYYKTDDATDSYMANMNDYFQDEENCLYVVASNPLNLSATISKTVAETRGRRYVMEFLCDNRPKLFRSAEEGNMIVHLSNISFTPNKQLDRHIYDFSATVTEVCEYNTKNLSKYKLNLGRYKEINQSINQEETIPVTARGGS